MAQAGSLEGPALDRPRLRRTASRGRARRLRGPALRLLVDTDVFLWWCADDTRLSPEEREAIRDGANEVYLSAASIWEIAIKQTLGRLRVPEPASAAAIRLGFQPLPVAFHHAEATASLPPLHRDPFDRMLIAQARAEGLTFVTHDLSIRAYPGVVFLPF